VKGLSPFEHPLNKASLEEFLLETCGTKHVFPVATLTHASSKQEKNSLMYVIWFEESKICFSP